MTGALARIFAFQAHKGRSRNTAARRTRLLTWIAATLIGAPFVGYGIYVHAIGADLRYVLRPGPEDIIHTGEALMYGVVGVFGFLIVLLLGETIIRTTPDNKADHKPKIDN